MLTITEPELVDEGETEAVGGDRKNIKKRVVLIMARQHPGESPASYVVQGRERKRRKKTSGAKLCQAQRCLVHLG